MWLQLPWHNHDQQAFRPRVTEKFLRPHELYNSRQIRVPGMPLFQIKAHDQGRLPLPTMVLGWGRFGISLLWRTHGNLHVTTAHRGCLYL